MMTSKELSIEQQLESLVVDLQDLNYELENKCGIRTGISNIIDNQNDFTKEILDAYLACSHMSKENIDKHFRIGNIEQKKAYTNLSVLHDSPRAITREEDIDLSDEAVLKITDLSIPLRMPENIPLPDDSDEDIKEMNALTVLETVAEIHATLLGDTQSMGNVSKVSNQSQQTSINSEGDYVINNRTLVSEQELIQTIKSSQKKKISLRTRIRNFFTKSSNSARNTQINQ